MYRQVLELFQSCDFTLLLMNLVLIDIYFFPCRLLRIWIRHMQPCFLHFGMRSSKACVRKIILATGKLEKMPLFIRSHFFVRFYVWLSFGFITSLYISLHGLYASREMDLLSIPSNTGSLRLVQWPLFLLSSKVEHVECSMLCMLVYLL